MSCDKGTIDYLKSKLKRDQKDFPYLRTILTEQKLCQTEEIRLSQYCQNAILTLFRERRV